MSEANPASPDTIFELVGYGRGGSPSYEPLRLFEKEATAGDWRNHIERAARDGRYCARYSLLASDHEWVPREPHDRYEVIEREVHSTEDER